MNVSISICPTSMEFASGDRYSEPALLNAIRQFVMKRHPNARITCLQVGYRQGDEWARVDGDDEAGCELMQEFWAATDTSDESLFEGNESSDAN